MLRYSKYLLSLALLGCSLCLSVSANSQSDSLVNQALVQAEAGDLKKAQSLLEEAVNTDPSSLAYTRLGGVHLLQQAYSSGIEHFQQAIMLDQSNSEAFIGLAVAYLHMGRYQLAREALKQAQQIDPTKKQEIDKVVTWLNQRSSQQSVH